MTLQCARGGNPSFDPVPFVPQGLYCRSDFYYSLFTHRPGKGGWRERERARASAYGLLYGRLHSHPIALHLPRRLTTLGGGDDDNNDKMKYRFGVLAHVFILCYYTLYFANPFSFPFFSIPPMHCLVEVLHYIDNSMYTNRIHRYTSILLLYDVSTTLHYHILYIIILTYKLTRNS